MGIPSRRSRSLLLLPLILSRSRPKRFWLWRRLLPTPRPVLRWSSLLWSTCSPSRCQRCPPPRWRASSPLLWPPLPAALLPPAASSHTPDPQTRPPSLTSPSPSPRRARSSRALTLPPCSPSTSMPPSLATDPVGGSTSPQTTVNPKAIFSPFHLQVDDSGLRVAPVPASTPLSPGNHPTPEQLLQLHVQKEYQAKLSIKEKLARRKSRRKSRHRRRSSSVSSPTSTSSDSGSFSDSLAGVFSSSITLSTSDSDPPAFNSGWGSGSGSGSGSEYYSYDLEVVQVTKPSFAKHVGVSTHAAAAPTHNDAPTHASATHTTDAPTHADA